MTNDTRTTGPNTGESAEDYRNSEGLRALLNRLHTAGRGAWEQDPVAAELMAFAAEKYAALARKHRLDPWEAASAAFDVMRTKAARTAEDPWGGRHPRGADHLRRRGTRPRSAVLDPPGPPPSLFGVP